jgi:hypothetical protein
MKLNVDLKPKDEKMNTTASSCDQAAVPAEAPVTENTPTTAPAPVAETAVNVTTGVACLDPGHVYELGGGNVVKFLKKVDGTLIHHGTTNEECLQMLIHRTKELNAKFPCKENDQAIIRMEEALMWFNERTAKRTAQGVETRYQNHEDVQHG